ncbi:MAG: TerC family protein [Alphaproteobacteria bacterium]|nr:TerC family protein [Alphaproteobacteria bacterium]
MQELSQLSTPQWWRSHFDELIKVFLIDVTLAGDNAIVVGLAASQVAPEIRGKVIFWGIAAAVILRILFAAVTQQLLAIVGLTLAGGILLAWVCWKMYRQIKDGDDEHSLAALENGDSPVTGGREMTFWAAVGQIIVADLSMSLDNVLAVAGAAGESEIVLIIGLALAVVLMAVAAHFIARLLVTYPWIAWLGLLMIVWVAADMIYRGSHEVTCEAFSFGCSEDLYHAILHRLGLGQ